MKTQRVRRVVNALAAQGRVIVTLACGHVLSVTAQDGFMLDQMQDHDVRWVLSLTTEDTVDCEACPDPTPLEIHEAKSATQLWREAGEP